MAADTAPEIDDDLPGDPPQPESKKAPAPSAAKAKAKPQPQPDPEPEPEPKKYTHSSRLVNVATELGFTQADLDNFPSAEIWEEIHRIQSLSAKQPAPQPETPKTPEPETDPDEAYLAELAEAEPRLAKLMRRAIARDDLKPINEKLARLDALEKAEQNRAARAATELVDAAFTALGEKFEPLVGTGSIAELTDPGQKGWRAEIYQRAKLDLANDSPAKINAKIAAAAKALAGDRVKEPEPTNDYDAAATRRTPPRDGGGRFTAADFERGQIHRPNGKQTGVDQLDDVEAARRYLREKGDPRGNHAPIDFGDEDLPE